MFKFNDELIKRITVYFADKYDHYIDEETANEYLNSMTEMFAIFAEHEDE
ncbi:MAG TPA: hypothetical protein VGO21_04140 [Candidatus Paceibacterota bacterium]|jgi:hypothetical protein|nr:hypothetical protein [Candidatus Paceibacterota bacterium]